MKRIHLFVRFLSDILGSHTVSPGWKPIRVEEPGRVGGQLTPGSGSPLKPGVVSSASQTPPPSPSHVGINAHFRTY